MTDKQTLKRCTLGSMIDVPSDGTLLLRTLRLLNLDELPDWPNCNNETFNGSRGAKVTQKERIRVAEWILFKLFEIWDAKECKSKLRPLHPALEPIQSLKLRAAILQWMAHLKASGVLGLECMPRKTLFDECKGEKFVELLLHFSAAVLRKVTQEQSKNSGYQPAVRESASNIIPTDRKDQQLAVLAYAYHASLKSSVATKLALEENLQNTSRKIASTKGNIATKKTALESELDIFQSLMITDKIEPTNLKKQLRHECTGDSDWLSVVISSDSTRNRVSFVESSFADIWSNTVTGEDFIQPEQIETGLLSALDQRVSLQIQRLAAWRFFQKEVSQRNEELIVRSPRKSPQKSPHRSAQKRNQLASGKPPSPSVRTNHMTSMSPQRKTVVKQRPHEAELPKKTLFAAPADSPNFRLSISQLHGNDFSAPSTGSSDVQQLKSRNDSLLPKQSPRPQEHQTDVTLPIRQRETQTDPTNQDIPSNGSSSERLAQRTLQTLQNSLAFTMNSSLQSSDAKKTISISQVSATGFTKSSLNPLISSPNGKETANIQLSNLVVEKHCSMTQDYKKAGMGAELPWSQQTQTPQKAEGQLTRQHGDTTLYNNISSSSEPENSDDITLSINKDDVATLVQTPTQVLLMEETDQASVFKTRNKLRQSPPLTPLASKINEQESPFCSR